MAAINGFRYPLLTDNPDIPEDMQFLATDVTSRLRSIVANPTELATLTGMTAGDRAYVSSTKSEAVYNGAAWAGHADDWVTIGSPLSGGWLACTETGSTSSTISPPQYRLLNGVVNIRGYVKSGATGSAIFTLPPGHRPAGTKLFLVTTASGQARVDITSAGAVFVYDYRNGGTSAYVSLNINYLAEQ